MAFPIAHVIYTDIFFKKLDGGKISSLKYPLGKIDRDEFLLGSIFPDIRIIDHQVKRSDTHMFFKKIDLDFSGLTSFEAGWKFHLYCDMKREELLNEYDFYSLENADSFDGRAVKLLEDELVYDKYDNWEKLNYYFNHPNFTKTGLEIGPETFSLWYAIIAKYIEKKPDDASIRIFISKIPSLREKVDDIMAAIGKLRKNRKAVELLQGVSESVI